MASPFIAWPFIASPFIACPFIAPAWGFIIPVWGFIICSPESVDVDSVAIASGEIATPTISVEAANIRVTRVLRSIVNSRNGDRSYAKAPDPFVRLYVHGRYIGV
jgi:hypothetical protein